MHREEIDIAGGSCLLTHFGFGEKRESDAQTVGIGRELVGIEHAVGNRDIGLAVLQRDVESRQCLRHGGAGSRCDGNAERDTGRDIHKRRGRAKGKIVQQQTAVDIDIDLFRRGISGIVNHLQACSADLRKRDHGTVRQRGIQTEGCAVLISSRVQKAGGENHCRATRQAAQIGIEGGYDRAVVVAGRHIERVGGGRHAKIAGHIAVLGIIHQGGHAAGDHVHRGRISGAMHRAKFDFGGILRTFAHAIAQKQGEIGVAAIGIGSKTGGIQHAIRNRDIGFTGVQRHGEVLDRLRRRSAVARRHTDLNRRSRRRINVRRGGAEREIVQQNVAIEIHVNAGGGGISGVVNHLQPRGLAQRCGRHGHEGEDRQQPSLAPLLHVLSCQT